MRSQAALGLPLAFAAVVSAMTTWRDRPWMYAPEKTEAWYKLRGKPLPVVAPELTVMEEHQSYVVRLECLGCPFRVRENGKLIETWQQPARDNSLLLNFTIDEPRTGIQLNGYPILDVASRPPALHAYQIPSNTSADTMNKMTKEEMIDRSWVVGTKLGSFELQYAHTLLATEKHGEEYLQFDVTAIHMRQRHNPGSYSLDRDNQKLVQLLLGQEMTDDGPIMTIKDIQVVKRKDRAQPMKMKCGRLAMVQTNYNPYEWDEFGKLDTWSRTLNKVTLEALQFLERKATIVVVAFNILAFIIGIVRCRVKEINEQCRAPEDPEAGAFASEDTEAPPDYSDIAQFAESRDEKRGLLSEDSKIEA